MRRRADDRARRSVHPLAMTRKLTALRVLALAVPAAALAIAGCGDSSPAAGTARAAGANTAVNVDRTGLGRVLADSHDRTLYLFEKDAGGKSTCSGPCASAWPPLLVHGKLVAVAGASSSLLGTTARSGGVRQATYDGHPLYYYAGDEVPGQTNGQGLDQFGAAWFVLSPTGKAITSAGTGGAVY